MSDNKVEDYRDILRELPVKTEPRCKICQSSVRPHVDRLIAAQFPYRAIAEQIQGTDPKLGKTLSALAKNVERHAKKHVNVRDRAVRSIIEQRAMEQGILLDSATTNLTTSRALVDVMIHRGLEQATDPDTRIKYQDVLEAVKLQQEMEQSTYVAELEDKQKQLWAISQAVKQIVPEEKYPELVAKAREIYETGSVPLPALEPARSGEHD
jgi:hypothetical protein